MLPSQETLKEVHVQTRAITILILLASSFCLSAQTARSSREGWRAAGANRDDFEMGIDSTTAHTGSRAGFMRSKADSTTGWGTWMQSFDATPYSGKRMRFSAYVKTENLADHVALWMRVDGSDGQLSFDNMGDRPIRGTTDWTEYTITLDVPQEARGIALGVILTGAGSVWIDDVVLTEEPAEASKRASAEARGVVNDESGRPIQDALIALVSSIDPYPTATARSDQQGRFALEGVPPGNYGITVTSPGLEAIYRQDVPVVAREAAEDLALVMRKGGTTIRGTVRDPHGKPVKGILVAAARFSEMTGDLFCATADGKGQYELTLPSGYEYLLTGATDAYDVTQETVLADQDRLVDLGLVPVAQPQAPAEVVEWIRQDAIPLTAPQAGIGFEDMEPIRGIVGDAHLVSLGEATHGTREFFRLKHRMLEFLANRMGFTVFGIEATFPEALDINRYVLTGEGDPEEALSNLHFWTWNTQEVLDMIRWMRAYNEDSSHVEKLKFYGFDMQFPSRAAAVALAYLQKMDWERANSFRNPLLIFYGDPRLFKELPPEQKVEIAASVTKMIDLFDANEAEFIRRSTSDEWSVARQHARVLQQYCEMATDDPIDAFGARDRAMAENIAWILEHEGPGTRMVAWAHNGHVSKGGDAEAGGGPMGSHLSRSMGRDMVVFGFGFNQGSFRAIDSRAERRGLSTFTVAPAPDGSLDQTLARTGLPIVALDLRTIPSEGPVARWFAEPHRMRGIGAVYNPAYDKSYCPMVTVTRGFDALLFVESTSAALQVARSASPIVYSPRAVNLDFEAVGP